MQDTENLILEHKKGWCKMIIDVGSQKVIQEVQVSQSLATRAMILGRQYHGHYMVLPPIGVLNQPTKFNGWLCVPREMDKSFIPREADRHIKLLKDNGFVIQQQIVLHEPEIEKPQKKPLVNPEQLKEAGSFALKAAGLVLGVCAALITGFAYMLALTIAYDPALCVVLEDGTWLVVCEWRS